MFCICRGLGSHPHQPSKRSEFRSLCAARDKLRRVNNEFMRSTSLSQLSKIKKNLFTLVKEQVTLFLQNVDEKEQNHNIIHEVSSKHLLKSEENTWLFQTFSKQPVTGGRPAVRRHGFKHSLQSWTRGPSNSSNPVLDKHSSKKTAFKPKCQINSYEHIPFKYYTL